ncbi:MAG: hypothetical protein EOP34_01790 [Rickettsiales bacterium]|nr:MAG: hypothetical protein EOP34_01790 [Rickettsiales bacterium]
MTNSTRNKFKTHPIACKFRLGFTILTVFFYFLFVTIFIYELLFILTILDISLKNLSLLNSDDLQILVVSFIFVIVMLGVSLSISVSIGISVTSILKWIAYYMIEGYFKHFS